MKNIFLFIIFLFFQQFLIGSNSTPNRHVDILHSIIDIKVDIISEQVIGKVSHKFSPLGTSVSSFDLDAEDMVIRRVRLGNKDIPFFPKRAKITYRPY